MAQEAIIWETWEDFKKFFAGYYHDLCEIQPINATQVGFNGANMAIIMQKDISVELENLYMATTSENIYSPS